MYDDTMIPYRLASMHPVLHLSLLWTSALLQVIEGNDFFVIVCEDIDLVCTDAVESENIEQREKANLFLKGGKFNLMA